MSQADIQKMRDLDEVAEKFGGFVDPVFKNNTHYDYRKMLDYCKKKKIDPLDLTIRELGQFTIQ